MYGDHMPEMDRRRGNSLPGKDEEAESSDDEDNAFSYNLTHK